MVNRVTLNIIKDGEVRDEMIHIVDAEHDFLVVLAPNDVDRTYKFHLSRSSVMDYVHDLLRSLSADHDPFDTFQVTTAIHPAILFHVLDIDKNAHLIKDMIYMALNTRITTSRA